MKIIIIIIIIIIINCDRSDCKSSREYGVIYSEVTCLTPFYIICFEIRSSGSKRNTSKKRTLTAENVCISLSMQIT